MFRKLAIGFALALVAPTFVLAWKLGEPPSKFLRDGERDLRHSEPGRIVHNPGEQAENLEQGIRHEVVDPVKDEFHRFERDKIRPLTPGHFMEKTIDTAQSAATAVVDHVAMRMGTRLSEAHRLMAQLIVLAAMSTVAAWLTIQLLKLVLVLPARAFRR